jgi:hypothetical protein
MVISSKGSFTLAILAVLYTKNWLVSALVDFYIFPKRKMEQSTLKNVNNSLNTNHRPILI